MLMNALKGMVVLGSSKDYLSLEFNSTDLRIAHVRLKGRNKECENLSFFDTSGKGDEEVCAIIQNCVEQFTLKDPEALLVIPSHLVVTKNIEVPSQDPSEIADIMNLQAGRHTPYAREEIIIDYLPVGVYRKSYTKILLIIVTKEVVKKQIEIVTSAGLRIHKVVFGPEAMGKFCSHLFKLDSYDFPVGMLSLDGAFSYFNIILKNTTIFARSIPIGLGHLQEEFSRYGQKFVEEVKKSIEVYRSEEIESLPQKVMLLGADAKLQSIEPLLCEAIGLPTESISFIGSLALSDAAKKTVSDIPPTLFLDGLSASFERDDLAIDLIPEEIQLQRQFEQRSREVIKTGIFSLAIFLLLFIFFVAKITFKNVYLEGLKEHSARLRQEAEQLEDKFQRIQRVNRHLSSRGRVLDALDSMYKNVPDAMRLLEVRFDAENETFSIKGEAESVTAIYSFIDDVADAVHFKDVNPPAIAQGIVGGEQVQTFSLVITLSGEVSR